jgi:hydrogenase expression/formation protein HypC
MGCIRIFVGFEQAMISHYTPAFTVKSALGFFLLFCTKSFDMCLAVPGKVVSIDQSDPEMIMAKVDFSGIVKDVCVQWLPEVKEGDYVLAHVGMALNIVDEEDAMETLELLREMGDLEAEMGEDGW